MDLNARIVIKEYVKQQKFLYGGGAGLRHPFWYVSLNSILGNFELICIEEMHLARPAVAK